MDFATGAMSTLLPKLGDLLLDEYNLKDRVKQGIKDLKAELESMEAALLKVSNVPLDQLDPQVKIWANEVRELSFVIEDSLDSSMVRVEGLQTTKPHSFKGFIKKTRNKVTKFKARHEIANAIKYIKIQVGRVKERYERYKFDDVFANVATTTVDPRLSSLYNKVSDLVGIDKSIDELVKMLSEGGDVSKKKLKIVSVVGIGGLGKTTLAKAVYEGRKNFFDCGAVVSVGQNPDVKKVLEDILYELDKKKYIHIIGSKMDEKKLIDEMREFLAEKRYLIVIDDVWNIETWEIIKCALMDSNPGSRIITTTRISEVAMKIGGVYSIKPLSDDNSKKLLFSRIFGDEGISPVDHYVEVSKKLLTKCGGVPLSIITIASLLAYKPRDEWPKVYDSIGFGYEDNEAVKNMRKILSFSYYDLPSCLKTCLLHLSTFPEDYLIKKNQLIWRWVAEGFIPNKQGAGSFELGEKYFNDLINRSMIRWIEPGIIVDQGGCRVHDMVLDLICTLSNELNFVTTQDTMQHNSCSPGTSKIGRRLAMHNARDIKHMDIGHVRSFYSNRFDIGDMPPLSSFKVLRVLSLEDCNFSGGGGGLEHLGKLVHLRYLGLLNTPVAELPSEIGHDLKFLQTLVVEGTGIKELPASVGELSKLMCLRASEGTRMVAQIGKLTAMEELQLYSADKCPNLITELGKLTEARVLSIYFDEMDESAHKVLVQSLGNLRKVQILEIEIEGRKWHHFGGWEDWAPPSQLHQLWLPSIIIPRWLSWMDSSRVPHLSFLNLAVEVIKEQDLRILGRMPLLRTLFICCENDLSYTVGSGEFQSLAELRTTIEIMCGERALPMLESLYCYASVGNDVGLAGNMPLLQFVAYQLDCKDRSAEEVEAMVAALRHTARTHPNCPMLRIKRSNNEFQPEYYYGDENDTSVQSKLTLDVRDSGIKELSPPVDGEDKLMRLRASKGTRLVSEIGKLTSLKELQLHHVDKSPNFATELGKLTEMNVLRIHFDQMDEWAHKILVKSLCNLHRLQNVEIWSEDESCAHLGVWEEWAPPTELDELSLYRIVFPRVPSWMNSSCVLDLSSLWLEVESVEMRDLQILGRLPSLHALYLRTGNHLLYSVGSDEFHKLRALFTDVKIMFEAEGGELPMLDVLECYASVGINVGLAGNMPLLKRVTYHLDCEGCNDEQVEAAEAALRHAAQVHPNRPTLEIERYGGSNVSQSGDDGVDKISLEEEAAAASQP